MWEQNASQKSKSSSDPDSISGDCGDPARWRSSNGPSELSGTYGVVKFNPPLWRCIAQEDLGKALGIFRVSAVAGSCQSVTSGSTHTGAEEM